MVGEFTCRDDNSKLSTEGSKDAVIGSSSSSKSSSDEESARREDGSGSSNRDLAEGEKYVDDRRPNRTGCAMMKLPSLSSSSPSSSSPSSSSLNTTSSQAAKHAALAFVSSTRLVSSSASSGISEGNCTSADGRGSKPPTTGVPLSKHTA